MSAKIVMNNRDINRSLGRLSLEILERNHGIDNLAIIGIHTGGVFLAERIHAMITASEQAELPQASLDITLYRDDWSLISQNPIVRQTNIDFNVEGKSVVLVDDVIFTGRTIRAAMDAIMDYGRPHSIQLAVLIDRGGRELPIQPDYVGMTMRAESSQRVDVLLAEKSDRDEVLILDK
ncbi:MAG: bifunctional pyr operon transcriptional regulator/uracil phosphoribosyltransferase PyrR [Desulfobulbus sp.]|nr:MAG: bifunctional pyr operon transcriptional regulator/uracil phosphoribosyltransferase PyrR [Desulfobulbus sp.]RUM37728.1 MAG: bifunctional pyr operon transcriptional regulator/uracil phosphoribosyltransferase PyrR [Desulfobulbus sp.]